MTQPKPERTTKMQEEIKAAGEAFEKIRPTIEEYKKPAAHREWWILFDEVGFPNLVANEPLNKKHESDEVVHVVEMSALVEAKQECANWFKSSQFNQDQVRKSQKIIDELSAQLTETQAEIAEETDRAAQLDRANDTLLAQRKELRAEIERLEQRLRIIYTRESTNAFPDSGIKVEMLNHDIDRFQAELATLKSENEKLRAQVKLDSDVNAHRLEIIASARKDLECP